MLESEQPPVLQDYRHSEISSLSAKELAEMILGDNGIYMQLESRWKAYKAHQKWHEAVLRGERVGPAPTFQDGGQTITGDKALSPCPVVDEALTRLVELCIGAYQEGTVAEFFDLVQNNETYRRRMAELPALTGSAEGEMEKHYAEAALKRITPPELGNGHVALSEDALHAIKEQAEGRLGKYLERNGIKFSYRDADDIREIVPDEAKDEELVKQARRILRLDETIKPFPYTHNYEHIAYGEHHLLTDPHVHQNFPKSLLEYQQQRLLEGRDGADARRIKDKNPETFGVAHLDEKYMTFVGSGALPLTGLMNHIISGCRINLIDKDPKAVAISQEFITHLESLSVLERGAVNAYRADGADVYYGGPRSDDLDRGEFAGELRRNVVHVEKGADGRKHFSRKDKIYIPTDVIYIAGLIPNHDKEAILWNLEENGKLKAHEHEKVPGTAENERDPVPSVIVRSARGLSRMLYEPLDEGVFDRNPYYHPHGTLVPERHVLNSREPVLAVQEDTITRNGVSAVLSDDNVNTAMLFHRSELPLINPQIELQEDTGLAKSMQAEHDREGKGYRLDFSHSEREKARQQLAEANASRQPTP